MERISWCRRLYCMLQRKNLSMAPSLCRSSGCRSCKVLAQNKHERVILDSVSSFINLYADEEIKVLMSEHPSMGEQLILRSGNEKLLLDLARLRFLPVLGVEVVGKSVEIVHERDYIHTQKH